MVLSMLSVRLGTVADVVIGRRLTQVRRRSVSYSALDWLLLGRGYEWVVPEFILWDILNIKEECFGNQQRCLIIWEAH